MVAVLVLLLLAGGAAFFLLKKHSSSAEEEETSAATHAEPAKVPVKVDPKAVPAYLPLDPMVVNLADEGGERVAQIGVTLELEDAHMIDTVKAYLPAIRSSILMLISQRTADELLKAEGKQKLADDIVEAAAEPFGGGHGNETTSKKKKVQVQYPVVGVLFSSFIVQ
nr:flagellar basal body-associated FliL family protein [Curvibacter sp. CHRR-16]